MITIRRLRPAEWALVAGVFSYLFGYSRGVVVNDVDSAAGAGWALVHRGTFAVGGTAWAVPGEVVQHGSRTYSDRPLGMVLLSAVMQLGRPGPSRAMMCLLAALLVGLTVWFLLRTYPSRLTVFAAVIGTPLLYVAGRTLWPETVCLTCLAAVLWLRGPGSSWWAWSWLPVFVATLCRLPFGLALAGVVVALSWGFPRGRTRSPVLPAVVGLVAAVVVLEVYAVAVFGTLSPAGGYPASHVFSLARLVTATVSPARGLFAWCPWLLLVRMRGRSLAVLGVLVAYTAGCVTLYDAWGGDGFPGFRYGLPLVVFAAAGLAGDGRPRWWRVARVVTLSWSTVIGWWVFVVSPVVGIERDSLQFFVPGVVLCSGALIAAGAGAVAVVRSRGEAQGSERSEVPVAVKA